MFGLNESTQYYVCQRLNIDANEKREEIYQEATEEIHRAQTQEFKVIS